MEKTNRSSLNEERKGPLVYGISDHKMEEETEFDSGTVMSGTDLNSTASFLSSDEDLPRDYSIPNMNSEKLCLGLKDTSSGLKEISSEMSLDSGLQMDSGVILSEEISATETIETAELDNIEEKEPSKDFTRLGDSLDFAQDSDGDTPLHLSIILGDLDLITEFMSKSKFNFNVLNSLNQTPLHLAVLTRMPNVTRRLIMAGAKVDLQDHAGNTPLHIACRAGDYDCVRALTLSASLQELQQARINNIPVNNKGNQLYKFRPEITLIRNYEGLTCLHLAVIAGAFHIVEYLSVQCGADINVQDGKSGQTVLHLCVQSQQLSPLQFLISRCHASLKVQNYARRTPLRLARVIYQYKPNDKTAEELLAELRNLSDEEEEITTDDEEEEEDDEMFDEE